MDVKQTLELLEQWWKSPEAFWSRPEFERSVVWVRVLALLFERQIPASLLPAALEFVVISIYKENKKLEDEGVPNSVIGLPPQIRTIALIYASEEDQFIASCAREVLLLCFHDFSRWEDAVEGFRNEETVDMSSLATLAERGHEPTKSVLETMPGDLSLHPNLRSRAKDILEQLGRPIEIK